MKKTKIKVLSPYDVWKIKNGKVYLGDEPLTETSKKNLKAEVIVLKQLHIWKVFQETLKQYAIDKAFNDSKNWEEVLAGKMMGHNLGVMLNIVNLIEKL